MTISEVSKKFELSADTLRYYERIGLIPPIPRTPSGLRDYNEESCNWIEFIKCMRNAGLPIEVLIEYVSLFYQGDKTISARKELLVEQREILRQKIIDMQKTLDRLDYKIGLYENNEMKKYEDKLSKK
jgi:DNA-binding transcriptional MerR regulator